MISASWCSQFYIIASPWVCTGPSDSILRNNIEVMKLSILVFKKTELSISLAILHSLWPVLKPEKVWVKQAVLWWRRPCGKEMMPPSKSQWGYRAWPEPGEWPWRWIISGLPTGQQWSLKTILSRARLEVIMAPTNTLITRGEKTLNQRAQAAQVPDPQKLWDTCYFRRFCSNLLCNNRQLIYLGRHIKYFGCEDFLEVPKKEIPDVNSRLIGKDPDAGKDWRQKEKRETEDEMVG